MNRYLSNAVVLCAAFAGLLAGCGRKNDANSELNKAARAFDQPVATPAPAATLSQPVAAAQPAAAPVEAAPPAQQLSQAMAAYKSGNLEDAVTRFQTLRASQAISPQQRMALQDALAAVMTDIYGLAAKGEPRAVAAVKQYELMQTSRRQP